jgi:hypothetical protein
MRRSAALAGVKWLLNSERLFITSVDPLRHASDLPDTDTFLNYLMIYRSLDVCSQYWHRLLTLVLGAPCSALFILVVIVKLLETADESERLSRLSKQWTYIREVPRSNLMRDTGYRKWDSSCIFLVSPGKYGVRTSIRPWPCSKNHSLFINRWLAQSYEKRLLALSFLSVGPHGTNNSALTGLIFIKFDFFFLHFSKIFRQNTSFIKIWQE